MDPTLWLDAADNDEDYNSAEYKCSEISSDVSPGINDKFYVMATTR